jgi:hypothetical protein
VLRLDVHLASEERGDRPAGDREHAAFAGDRDRHARGGAGDDQSETTIEASRLPRAGSQVDVLA